METSYHENYAKQLQKLLNTVVKSQKRYIDAADNIDSADFKNLFNNYAEQRNSIITELKQSIHALGAEVKDHTDTENQTHHQHSSSSSNPNAKKEQQILDKLRSSEQETLDAYDDVLQGTILEEFNLKTILMGHRLIINETFTELDRKYFDLFNLSEPY